MFDESQRKLLLMLARQTIEAQLELSPGIQPVSEDFLQEPRALFITLKIGDELRGCIGSIQANESLLEAIVHCANSAAFADPRFPPLTKAEYPLIHLEVSVLSPFQRIQNPVDVIPGVHGVMISRSYYRGLLLPQVATEYDWDRDTFLSHTCLKAGLPPDAWKDPSTSIEIFTAEVFSEKELS
jgi:AmmeMemoRadiSam system protein A